MTFSEIEKCRNSLKFFNNLAENLIKSLILENSEKTNLRLT